MHGSPPPEIDRRAVEAWFRRRGLPLVIRRRRASALLQRATPALVFLLLIDPLLASLGVLLAVGDEEFERLVDNPGYVIGLLTLTVAALVVPVLAGWLVGKWMRRLPEHARRVMATTVLALTVVVLPVVEGVAGLRGGLWTYLLLNVLSVPVVLLGVYIGAGSRCRCSSRCSPACTSPPPRPPTRTTASRSSSHCWKTSGSASRPGRFILPVGQAPTSGNNDRRGNFPMGT